MIERFREAGGVRSRALYSPCEQYRYLLCRDWSEGARVLYIMLNPSTATETRNDPTIERCQRRAVALGFAGFSVANLFAFRATDPAELKRSTAPVGAENGATLIGAARQAEMVLCGWGVHGALFDRGAAVERLLREAEVPLWHLGLTKHGHPRHPLYVGYDRPPARWPDSAR